MDQDAMDECGDNKIGFINSEGKTDEDFQEQDDFILGDLQNNIQKRPGIMTNLIFLTNLLQFLEEINFCNKLVFDRSLIANEHAKNNTDLNIFDSESVSVYDAETLEAGLIDQVFVPWIYFTSSRVARLIWFRGVKTGVKMYPYAFFKNFFTKF